MKKLSILIASLFLIFSITGCDGGSVIPNNNANNNNTISSQVSTQTKFDFASIPAYNGSPIYVVNNNIPFFTDAEITTTSFETYAELDALGRCGVATACLSKDTMPAEGETRGEIGNVKPAGWHTVKYPDVISDLYLYNRCHLIGWQLGAENANVKNLTTGTRYLNVEGMLPYENLVDNYIEVTNNHVMYRVTPIFVDDELVCRGVLIEAKSVEDNNCVFCVYCYNVQPGIKINYLTGDSKQITLSQEVKPTSPDAKYVLNTSTMKIHTFDCEYALSISDKNRYETISDIESLALDGYTPCKVCNPQ